MTVLYMYVSFFFSSRRRHTRCSRDWSSDVCSSDLCPENKLGKIDIYIVSHHGTSSSNSPAFLDAIAPRVAVMDNGAAKGGAPSSWDAVKSSTRLEDF